MLLDVGREQVGKLGTYHAVEAASAPFDFHDFHSVQIALTLSIQRQVYLSESP